MILLNINLHFKPYILSRLNSPLSYALRLLNCHCAVYELQSIYTIRGDVWSFAVTVWEVLTLGSELPLSSLSDEQVVANSALARRGAVSARPARPPTCPPETYDLLVECWNADEHRRPTFREIDMFLRRKNMGFRPYVDNVVDETSAGHLAADTSPVHPTSSILAEYCK